MLCEFRVDCVWDGIELSTVDFIYVWTFCVFLCAERPVCMSVVQYRLCTTLSVGRRCYMCVWRVADSLKTRRWYWGVRTFRRHILDFSTTTLWTFRRQICVNFVPCLISVTVILPLCNVRSSYCYSQWTSRNHRRARCDILSNCGYCADRTQSPPWPAPNIWLTIFQISSKSVHFRRSYSRPREGRSKCTIESY